MEISGKNESSVTLVLTRDPSPSANHFLRRKTGPDALPTKPDDGLTSAAIVGEHFVWRIRRRSLG